MNLIPIPQQSNAESPFFTTGEGATVAAMYKDFYGQIGYHPPWIGYGITDGERLLGVVSFNGPPVNGEVEISYWTFAENEGKGIASYGCGQLVKMTRNHDALLTVTAKTKPEENASTRILRRHGFTQTGTVQDHEIGDAWLWKKLPGEM